jgi:hypothetical protein
MIENQHFIIHLGSTNSTIPENRGAKLLKLIQNQKKWAINFEELYILE